MSFQKIIGLISGLLATVLLVAFSYLGINAFIEYRSQKLSFANLIFEGTFGDKLHGIPSFQPSQKTLLIVLSTSCKYCDESVPFYLELAEHQKQGINIVTAFREDTIFVDNFLSKNKLQFERLSNVDFGEIGVRGTPSIILMDEEKKIISFWEGKLNSTQEAQIKAEIAH